MRNFLGHAAFLLLLVSTQVAVAADKTTEGHPKGLRNVPCARHVKSIQANWFDDGYRSFVRDWGVPQRHWKPVLKAVRESRNRKVAEEPSAKTVQSNHLHLRINTNDGRSLLIVTYDKAGSLRAYPFKGCKTPFIFADRAAPFLRDRLGKQYRITVQEERAKSEKPKRQ